MPSLRDRQLRMVVGTLTTIDSNTGRLTVPAGSEWFIHSVWAKVITTATVGNRLVAFRFFDDSDVAVFDRALAPAVVITASLTRYVAFGAGGDPAIAPAFDEAMVFGSLPPMLLQPGWYIHLDDLTAVDEANDTYQFFATVSQERI